MAEYSITRLLVMKATMAKQIEAALQAVSTHSAWATVVRSSTTTEAQKQAVKAAQTSAHDKLKSLMSNHAKVAAAISKSNAVTKLTVAGVEMTVAEAIARRENIDTEKHIVAYMRSAIARRDKELEVASNAIDREVQNRLQHALGSDKGATHAAAIMASVTEAVRKDMAVEVVSFAANLDKLYEDKRDELDAFIADVDVALNESNALTKVELEL